MTMLVALFVLPATAVYAGNVQYVYDAAGRLTGLIDQNGNPAIYNYDANGNILSIATPGSGTINALGFAPASGSVGTSVTITGTGFGATASQDSVQFNGTSASITSATTNQIVVAVPSGATTGPISVSSPAGQATTTQSFTVTPTPPGAPTITSFSPASGGVGDTVVIIGTNFSSSAASETVAFGSVDGQVTATSPTSITVLVPAGAFTGPISVSTPSGSATSSGSFYAIPGGYNSTDIGATAADSYGNSVTLNVSNANDGYLATFSGNAGDRVSVNVLESGSMTLANASVFGPNGALLYGPVGTQTIPPTNPVDPGFLLGPFVLPATGVYTVLIAPENGSTGTAQITVYNVPPDLTTTLTNGTAVNVGLLTPGQKASFTVSGTAGGTLAIQLSAPSQGYTEGLLAVYNPDGSALYSTGNLTAYPNNYSELLGPYSITQTGTYRVVFVPYQSYVFSGTLTAWSAPPNPTAAATFGSAITQTVGTPYQGVNFTFSGTAGQRVSFNESYTLSGNNCSFGTLYNPDGSVLTSTLQTCGSPAFWGPFTLPQTGTYTVIVTPGSGATGSVTMTVNNVPADPVTAVTSGSAVTESLSTPGQSADYTFSGTAGQRVSFSESYSLSGNNCSFGTLYNPDGTVLSSTLQTCGNPAFFGPFTLAQTGTYKVIVTPGSGATGTVTMTYYNVPPDLTATLTIGGPSATLTTTTPGQSADFTFSGTSGQSLHFSETYSLAGSPCSFGTLYNPDGSVLSTSLQTCGSPAAFGPYTLSQTGTQELIVTPGSGATGTITFSVTSP